jgi:hypothetical protein
MEHLAPVNAARNLLFYITLRYFGTAFALRQEIVARDAVLTFGMSRVKGVVIALSTVRI